MGFTDDGTLIFEESVVVGSIQEAEIIDMEINNENVKALKTTGFLYTQRYLKFIEWLKEEIKNNPLHGSIEICGKGSSKVIEYVDGSRNSDGTMKKGRVPKIFDFSGLAILGSLCPPADSYSVVVEINKNNKEGVAQMAKTKTNKVIKAPQTIELNELSVDDLGTLIT